MTEEQLKTSKRNRTALRKKLGIKGNRNLDLHHVDTSLKHNDIDRYIQWNEEDVIILTKAEHRRLHWLGKKRGSAWNKGLTADTDSRIARNSGEKNGMYGRPAPNKGRPISDEQKRKQSDAMKGRIPWNKGLKKGVLNEI